MASADGLSDLEKELERRRKPRQRVTHGWWKERLATSGPAGLAEELLWWARHEPPEEILWLARLGLLRRYYGWYQFWYRRHHAKYLRSREPILVYQMGRVGSTTLWRSIEKATDRAVLHTHHLSRDRRHHAARRALEAGHGSDRDLRKYSKIRYFENLLRADDGKRWKVPVIVREPGSRSLSRFFHSQHKFLLDLAGERPEDLLPVLQKRYVDLEEQQIHEMSSWFVDNVGLETGIDLFARPFPHEAGYQVTVGERMDLMVVRLEDLARVGPRAIAELLGIGDVEILWANATADDEGKAFADVYSRFKGYVRPDPEFLDRLYAIPWVRHYYSAEEIARFKARWLGNPAPR